MVNCVERFTQHSDRSRRGDINNSWRRLLLYPNSESSGTNCFKIQKQYIRVNRRAFSFASRCIDAWNSLDNDVLCASSVPDLELVHYVI